MMRVEPRRPMGKDWAASAYGKALESLEPRHAWHFHGIREHVRHLRAECARMRVRAQEAERENKLLRIELEERKGGTHE